MRNEYLEYTNKEFLGNKDYGKSYVYEKNKCENVSKLMEPKLRKLLTLIFVISS